MKKLLILMGFLFMLISCSEDFLEEPPSKNNSLQIKSVEQLAGILNNNVFTENIFADAINVYCTDNTEIPTQLFDAAQGEGFSPEDFDQYTWQTTIENVSEAVYLHHYFIIAQMNVILENIDRSDVEGDDMERREVRAEAYLRRAWSYLQLASVYTLPYSEANLEEMGLVLRQTTSPTESQIRSNLKDTYDFIEADILEALKHPVLEHREGGRWRYTKPAADALASRFYLITGDYEKAEEHASAALSAHSTMLDYQNEIFELGAFNFGDGFDVVYPSSFFHFNSTDYNSFHRDYFFSQANTNFRINTPPSQELISLIQPGDIRSFFFVENGHMWVSNRYADFPYFTYVRQPFVRMQGLSVPECYLTRAECRARLGDIGGAMEDLEVVRINRFRSDMYNPLPIPATPKIAVEEIIDERRREFPYSLRWIDIRRLNTDPLTDPITITREFYEVSNGSVSSNSAPRTYTLEPNDRRYARPLAPNTIFKSQGQTEQNTY
ncbi:RagB/SusD family nutrient uptake outer membrane protein [Flagellimonas hymeniacidonis]|nr:RagB/SusD family nutrient uptake outer membrane protein [Flagellimonas hymeniacidonis]